MQPGEIFKNIEELKYWGGHTYDDHINCDDSYLKDRLFYGDMEMGHLVGKLHGIASKFHNEEIALSSINNVLKCNQDIIEKWLADRCMGELVLTANFLDEVGYALAKNTPFRNHYECYRVKVVLKLGYNGNNFNVTTAYPEPNESVAHRIQVDRVAFIKNKPKKKRY